MIKEVGRKLDNIIKSAGCFLIGGSVSLLFATAFMREALRTSQDYLCDITVWLVVWSFMLLLGPALRDGQHVHVGAVFTRLKPRVQRGIMLVNMLCTLCFALLAVVGGVPHVHALISTHQVYARVIRVPMWVAHICVPVGGAILLVYAALEVWRAVKAIRSSQRKGTKE